MNRSDSITSLAASLAKAQAVMNAAMKDSENPHFRSRYADLASVWDACREPLTSNGLSVVQLPAVSDKGSITVETILLHESGEWISGSIEIPVTKHDAQGVGSAITYARRYSLAAVVGVSPDDDDGEGAVGRGSEKKTQPTSPATRGPSAATTARHDGGNNLDPKAGQPSTEKQAPAPNAEADAKREEHLERVRGALRHLFGGDKNAALEHCEKLSEWVDKDSGEVKAKGERDYRKLKGKRLEILCHKLEAEAKKLQSPSPPEPHSATCETCGSTLEADGQCPSCPF